MSWFNAVNRGRASCVAPRSPWVSALAGVMCVDASEIALDLISRVWSSSRVSQETLLLLSGNKHTRSFSMTSTQRLIQRGKTWSTGSWWRARDVFLCAVDGFLSRVIWLLLWHLQITLWDLKHSTLRRLWWSFDFTIIHPVNSVG